MFQETENVEEEYLIGWSEIRSALKNVEKLRREGQDARVEIINSIKNATLRITLRSERELEEYFNSHLRRLILSDFVEDRSCVSGRVMVQKR